MALMRVDGVGAPMDYKKALMWLELAGKPSDVSYQLLIQWFTQAAEQVHFQAVYSQTYALC